jgi:hypothetical protein
VSWSNVRAGQWTIDAWGGRTLDNTNDFRVPFDSGNSWAALFASQDRYDYVDRRSATLGLTRRIAKRGLQLRGEFGYADDRYQPASLEHGPFGGKDYRPNRGVDEGGFMRSAAIIDFRPDVSAEFLKPGVSLRALYERGDGTLSFRRIEGRMVARQPFGPFVAVTRAEIGTLLSDRPPPQQLFELGEHQKLAGLRRQGICRNDCWRGPWLGAVHEPIPASAHALPAVLHAGNCTGTERRHSEWLDQGRLRCRTRIDQPPRCC